MSLSDDLTKRLDGLKKTVQEFSIFVNSIEGKKIFKESEVTSLERQIEKLKEVQIAEQAKASAILQKANEEARLKLDQAKKLLETGALQKKEAQEELETAKRMKNEATALMSQAVQRQKDADIQYNTYFEKKKQLEAVLR